MTARKADWGKRTANKKTPGTTVELDDRVEVPATPERVWERLEDVKLVASCLPGLDPATLVAESESAFRARMVNTVMGISASWDLHATVEPDTDERRLTVHLDGTDERLNMKLRGTAEVVVVPGASSAQAVLDYNANLRIDGSLAAMGGPVVRSIMADALAQFIAVVGGAAPPERATWWTRFKTFVKTAWRSGFRRTRVDAQSNSGVLESN